MSNFVPPFEYLCLHFIGGPFNSQQQYLPWKKYTNLRHDGDIFTKMYDMELSLGPNLDLSRAFTAQARYKLTFIPAYETPFADSQVVIGIFQE